MIYEFQPPHNWILNCFLLIGNTLVCKINVVKLVVHVTLLLYILYYFQILLQYIEYTNFMKNNNKLLRTEFECF